MSEKQSSVNRGTVLTYEVDGSERLSEGVVAAVSTVSDTDPAEMDPLAETIDPDALNSLFAAQHDGTPRAVGNARFSFFDYDIVVSSDGRISVLDSV
ncbi:HalOD1 output domain-containing protein [Halorussus salinisoli]|uniref:HalOD1 output domain-containing protein n=1 Tax=Halorussus salinisoli TaxID=2558242 RepID=UPI0010C24528|nr:HalOD1 output domain-containing protein [Halorussus salinisoli]